MNLHKKFSEIVLSMYFTFIHFISWKNSENFNYLLYTMKSIYHFKIKAKWLQNPSELSLNFEKVNQLVSYNLLAAINSKLQKSFIKTQEKVAIISNIDNMMVLFF